MSAFLGVSPVIGQTSIRTAPPTLVATYADYGLEGDWSWLGGIKTSMGDAEISKSFDVRWVSTLRGRAGLAVDATLIYITGGLAFGRVDNSIIANVDDGGLVGSFLDDKTRLE
jgi:opacity protein-like surface antigen